MAENSWTDLNRRIGDDFPMLGLPQGFCQILLCQASMCLCAFSIIPIARSTMAPIAIASPQKT